MDLEKLVGLTLHGKCEQETQIFEECFRLVGSQKTQKEQDIGFCLLARMVEKASPNTLRSFQSRLANRFAQISDKFTFSGCLFVREVLVKNPKSGDLHSTTVSKIINQCIDVGVQTEDPTIRALASDLFGLRANSNHNIAQLINTISALQNPLKTSNSSEILELSTFGISSLKISLQNLLFECLAWSMGQIQISGISIDRKNVIRCIENGIKLRETRHVAFVCLRSLCANAKWSILPMIPRIVSSLISDLDNIDSDLIETLAFISQIFGPINSTLYKHFYVLFSAIKQPLHTQQFALPAANLFANIIENSAAFVKPEIFISVQKLICELAIRFVDVDLYQMILAAFMALGNEYVPSPLQIAQVVCSRTKSRSEITQNLRKMCQIAARPRVTDIANIKAKKTISLKESAVIQEEIVEKAEKMEISEIPEEEEAENLSENEEEEEEEIQIIEPEPKKEPEHKRKSERIPEKVEAQPKKKAKVVVKEVNLLAGEQSVDDILNFFDPS